MVGGWIPRAKATLPVKCSYIPKRLPSATNVLEYVVQGSLPLAITFRACSARVKKLRSA